MSIIGDSRRKKQTAEERFWAKVDVRGPDECWEWTGILVGNKTHKYGQFKVAGRKTSTHRFSWEIAHGPIPDGLWVLHTCDNPPCCNPKHLFLGTHADNMRDRNAKGRANLPSGDDNVARKHPERMPRGEMHRMAKLRTEQVREMRRLRSEGALLLDLAQQFGVSRSMVSLICLGKNWKGVE